MLSRPPAAAIAGDGEPAAPHTAAAEMPAEVPAVDVRANLTPKGGQPDPITPPPGDTARRGPQAVPARPSADERQDAFGGGVRVAPPVNEAASRGEYVPLPHKTITVNSLEDLKMLQEEFATGRRRQAAESGRR
jgi:hypothetical protein